MALPLLAAALLLSVGSGLTESDAAPIIDPIDLHGCTSTSRCTGVYVDPSAPCVTVWYVDYEEDPSFNSC